MASTPVWCNRSCSPSTRENHMTIRHCILHPLIQGGYMLQHIHTSEQWELAVHIRTHTVWWGDSLGTSGAHAVHGQGREMWHNKKCAALGGGGERSSHGAACMTDSPKTWSPHNVWMRGLQHTDTKKVGLEPGLWSAILLLTVVRLFTKACGDKMLNLGITWMSQLISTHRNTVVRSHRKPHKTVTHWSQNHHKTWPDVRYCSKLI